jgi:hypothetical protein
MRHRVRFRSVEGMMTMHTAASATTTTTTTEGNSNVTTRNISARTIANNGTAHNAHVIAWMAGNVRHYYNVTNDNDRAIGRAWYPGMHAVLSAHAADTGLSVEQCADVYAMASINTPWSRNVAFAASCIADYALDILPGERDPEHAGHLAPVVHGIHRILTMGDTVDDIIGDESALKIRSFTRNLRDDADYVTCDRWAYRAAYAFNDCATRGIGSCSIQRGKPAHGCGMVPTGDAYREMDAAYRIVAIETGERAHDLQAIVWVAVRGTGE